MTKYDVVYLLAKSDWGEDVRYSLRSFQRCFPDLGEVWIVGHLPDYLSPNQVHHIPEPAMPQHGIFVESTARRLINESLDGLSEDYITADDDQYVLREVTYQDFAPQWVQDLRQVRTRGTRPWQQMLWRTYDLLIHMGYTGYNFESHTPSQVNRVRYADIANQFVNIEQHAIHRYHGICSITAYWNMHQTEKGDKFNIPPFIIGLIPWLFPLK